MTQGNLKAAMARAESDIDGVIGSIKEVCSDSRIRPSSGEVSISTKCYQDLENQVSTMASEISQLKSMNEELANSHQWMSNELSRVRRVASKYRDMAMTEVPV